MSTLSVKWQHRGLFRRFSVTTPAYEEVLKKMTLLVPEFDEKFAWKDSDGDLIAVGTTMELQEAMRVMAANGGDGLLRLFSLHTEPNTVLSTPRVEKIQEKEPTLEEVKEEEEEIDPIADRSPDNDCACDEHNSPSGGPCGPPVSPAPPQGFQLPWAVAAHSSLYGSRSSVSCISSDDESEGDERRKSRKSTIRNKAASKKKKSRSVVALSETPETETRRTGEELNCPFLAPSEEAKLQPPRTFAAKAKVFRKVEKHNIDNLYLVPKRNSNDGGFLMFDPELSVKFSVQLLEYAAKVATQAVPKTAARWPLGRLARFADKAFKQTQDKAGIIVPQTLSKSDGYRHEFPLLQPHVLKVAVALKHIMGTIAVLYIRLAPRHSLFYAPLQLHKPSDKHLEAVGQIIASQPPFFAELSRQALIYLPTVVTEFKLTKDEMKLAMCEAHHRMNETFEMRKKASNRIFRRLNGNEEAHKTNPVAPTVPATVNDGHNSSSNDGSVDDNSTAPLWGKRRKRERKKTNGKRRKIQGGERSKKVGNTGSADEDNDSVLSATVNANTGRRRSARNAAQVAASAISDLNVNHSVSVTTDEQRERVETDVAPTHSNTKIIGATYGDTAFVEGDSDLAGEMTDRSDDEEMLDCITIN